MTTLAKFAALVIALITIACTSANPAAHRDDQGDATDAAATPDEAGAAPECDTGADDGTGGAHGGAPPRVDTSSTCDGPAERKVEPDCEGGTMERATDGAIVCHWPCVGSADVTTVVVERAPGCYVLDDMVCHQCTDRIPSSWEPSPMPCPDVVRLIW